MSFGSETVPHKKASAASFAEVPRRQSRLATTIGVLDQSVVPRCGLSEMPTNSILAIKSHPGILS
jgi:hypothetical protein